MLSLDLNKDFQLVEIPKYQSGAEVRNVIKDENYAEFKNMVPKSIVPDFFNLKNEMNGINESKLENTKLDSNINKINESSENIDEDEKAEEKK